MANQAIFVSGDKEVDTAFAQFVPKLQKTVLRKATREATKIVERDAKANAPVVSGTLAKTIRTRALPRSRKSQGHGVMAFATTSEAFYALILEFGSVRRYHKSGKYVGQIEGQKHSFFRAALYDNERQVHRTFIKTLWRGISELYRPKKQRIPRV